MRQNILICQQMYPEEKFLIKLEKSRENKQVEKMYIFIKHSEID